MASPWTSALSANRPFEAECHVNWCAKLKAGPSLDRSELTVTFGKRYGTSPLFLMGR